MSVFKAVGIILVLGTCFLCGFSKSSSVLNRHKKMLLFCEGLNNLYEYIEQENGELETVLKNAFIKCDFLSFENGNISVRDGDLTAEDRRVIKDFLVQLGSSAKKFDCDRIKSFEKITKQQLCNSEKDTKQKSKIYITFSLCIGFTVAILLI